MSETNIELNVRASVAADSDSCVSASAALDVRVSVPGDSEVCVSVPGDSEVRASVSTDSDSCVSASAALDVRVSVPVDLDLDVPVSIRYYEESESDWDEDQSNYEGTTRKTLNIFAIVIAVASGCVGSYFGYSYYVSLGLPVLSEEVMNAIKIAIPILIGLAVLLCCVCKKRGLCCFKSEETIDEDAERRRDIAVRVMALM